MRNPWLGAGLTTIIGATEAEARRPHGARVDPVTRVRGGGHRLIVWIPEQVADDIEHWFKGEAAIL
ncbi:hypothetical protein [Paraburkholderia silvatlantica]|uniref:hypothetical protein n=1 Tax=Paraburkholderia silvatlantica TaxID=321895 RepID=UPI00105EF48F|nr:hypothetical protein [Paraburkholderia silvatlantica]TDQ98513.1 hypothetical protein C7412_105138 [Paraburkholderia silvatlantica]